MPKGILSWVQLWETQYAIREAMERVVGMGVPSKYFDLPVLSLGRTATVTLNRASRVSPQRTKKASRRWSTVVRIPRANAAAAGARPNEICFLENQNAPFGKNRQFEGTLPDLQVNQALDPSATTSCANAQSSHP